MQKIIKTSNYFSKVIYVLYRNLIVKTAFRVLRRHQTDAPIKFWTMPFDSICEAMILDNFYELELLEGLRRLVGEKDGIVVDIGANIGNHSLYFSRFYSEVFSFEPIPSNVCIFKANLALNQIKNVFLIEKALSDRNAAFSVDTTNPLNTNKILLDSNARSDGQILIEAVKGDQELKKIEPHKKIVLIKIDVEGHEPRVVNGLLETIRLHKPLIAWEAFNRADAEKTKSLLQGCDYQYFYHLSTNLYQKRFRNKLRRVFNRDAILYHFDSCLGFDGLNIASPYRLQ